MTVDKHDFDVLHSRVFLKNNLSNALKKYFRVYIVSSKQSGGSENSEFSLEVELGPCKQVKSVLLLKYC